MAVKTELMNEQGLFYDTGINEDSLTVDIYAANGQENHFAETIRNIDRKDMEQLLVDLHNAIKPLLAPYFRKAGSNAQEL